MGGGSIDPSIIRERVIQLLAGLPPDEHLDALHAIDSGDVELDLTEPDTVRIELARRWVFEVPSSQLSAG